MNSCFDFSVYSICIWTVIGGKTETHASTVSAKEINATTDKVLGAFELRNNHNVNTMTTPTSVPQSCTVLPSEGRTQV